MEAVALWVNRKPNKEFDLQMTGSQEVLFWYERTIISLQFFINLIRRKNFRIQASMNTENVKKRREPPAGGTPYFQSQSATGIKRDSQSL